MQTRWISFALTAAFGWFGFSASGLSVSGLSASAMTQPHSNPSNHSTDLINTEDLANTEWLLEDLGGSGVLDRVQTTLRFGDDYRITGTGGCNRYFAGIEQEGDRLSVGVIGSTQRLCPPAVMDQESRYFRAIESAQTVRLEGAFLFIDSEELEQPLRFTQILGEDSAASSSESSSIVIPFEDTVQLFHAGDYAVRVFREGEELAINLFNTQTQTLELDAGSATREPNPEGTDYIHRGDRTVKIFVSQSGEQQLVIDDEWQHNTESSSAKTLTGTVTYRQRIALSPDAVLEVRLLDISRQDAAAETLATITVPTAGQQVPLAFQLGYHSEQILPGRTYGLQARIWVGGELQYISTSVNPVFDADPQTPTEIVVDPV
ncbi:MAG: YbaY family lipoprotein [Leptolyngbyaceae bacterium]|nr:YbaY family lipoprotein [Leptolyngbyaceae bacterium]